MTTLLKFSQSLLYFAAIFSFTPLVQAQNEMTANQAYQEALSKNFQANEISPQAREVLRNYRGPTPDEERYQGFIRVFIENQRGFLIPEFVQENRWSPNKPGARYSPMGPSIEDQVWIRNEQGSPQLVTCDRNVSKCRLPQSTRTARSCHANRLLPKGTTFSQIRQPGFDCLSQKAKESDILALACNMYFESRAEGALGKELVAEVTLNRSRNNTLNNRRDQTIRSVVYAHKQFSWTEGPAVVNFRENNADVDRKAWYEALTLAASSLNLDENGVAVVHNPKLICYDYYLSLHNYKSIESFPMWARIYYEASLQTSDRASKPLCIGAHIFMRNPRGTCDSTPRLRDAEADDKNLAFRNDFYQNCLGQPSGDPGREPVPQTPNNAICQAKNLDDAVCAQLSAHPTYNAGGNRILCGRSSPSSGATGKTDSRN